MDVEGGVVEVGVVHQAQVHRNRRLDGADLEFAERDLHAGDGDLARWAVHDELADHRVVVGRNAVAGARVRIEAHAQTARRGELFDEASLRHKSAIRILGVDAALDRVAVHLDVGLLDRQRLARRHHDLLAHDVDARDHFGDRMLDLHAGVHLEHVEVLLGIHQKLDGCRAGILRAGDECGRAFADLLALGGIDARSRRLLNELLVAALARAVALEEMHGVAMLVADGLNLEMARILEEFLDVHRAVAERGGCFLARALDASAQLRFITSHPHAASTTAGGRLDDDGVANFSSNLHRVVDVLDRILGARKDGRADPARHLLAADLVAEQRHRFGRRTDELEAAVTTDFGEVRVLRKEAVAGVNGVGVRDFGGGDDAVDAQIALRTRAGADADGLIGLLEPWTVLVGGRIHTDGLDAEGLGGADDAQGDLAAVCNQDSLEHRCSERCAGMHGRGLGPERGRGRGLARADAEQRLTKLDGLTALDEHFLDGA